jgi:hypothetical protein
VKLRTAVLLVALFWTVVLYVTTAHSQAVGPPRPVKFCDVCAGFTVSKKGDDVFIRCPGQPVTSPWMTINTCPDPKVNRTAPNNVSITCSLVKSAQASSK